MAGGRREESSSSLTLTLFRTRRGLVSSLSFPSPFCKREADSRFPRGPSSSGGVPPALSTSSLSLQSTASIHLRPRVDVEGAHFIAIPAHGLERGVVITQLSFPAQEVLLLEDGQPRVAVVLQGRESEHQGVSRKPQQAPAPQLSSPKISLPSPALWKDSKATGTGNLIRGKTFPKFTQNKQGQQALVIKAKKKIIKKNQYDTQQQGIGGKLECCTRVKSRVWRSGFKS